MNNIDIHSIYDQLCSALTEYENDDGSGDAGDAGELLYQRLCIIVNDFASKLN